MANRLISENSPYLLQHADNPVDWHPWDGEALALAQKTGKPILLSIGYSACHWCHVMAHESFEDPTTAARMNALYVNIKVDREERPDVDKIYQTAQHLLTQRSGGWPLTMFLTPNLVPFFGGTYFPPEARYGMPAFIEVLNRAADYFAQHGEQVAEQGKALVEAMKKLNPPPSEKTLTRLPLELARRIYEDQFDTTEGGFGPAPKFPHPGHLNRLLRHWRQTAESAEPDVQALYMATLTLGRMAQRGLNDQLGGGFFRYSVDHAWSIPHFEKMLYDNALLLASYSDAFAATGELYFREVAIETAAWALREMQHVEGGFYSALDADSEGGEGKFYLWTQQQVVSAIGEPHASMVMAHFGLDAPANFEDEAWHLCLAKDPEEIALEFQLSKAEVQSTLERGRTAMLEHREKRIRPGRDEKILSSWNGLMIKGLATAARRLDEPPLADAAAQAADFIQRNLWKDGRLLAVNTNGHSRIAGYLDDYVFLADGLLTLLEYEWKTSHLEWIIDLLETILQRFVATDGGFYFAEQDHEPLIHRPKHFSDEATPAGNGIAAQVFLTIGHLVGEKRYLDAAEGTLRAAWAAIEKYPHAHESLLEGLEQYLDPHETIVVRTTDADVPAWKTWLHAGFFPRRRAFLIPGEETSLPGLLDRRRGEPNRSVAYVCHGTSCSAPVHSIAELSKLLDPVTKEEG